MRALISGGPLSPSALRQAIPLLLLIAGVLTMTSIIMRQLGYDSRLVQVVDAGSNEVKDYRIVTVLPRDGIAAISNPSFVSAAEAERWMGRFEQVIGLEIEGEAKAYPINILSRHEIVNDAVGGRPVAVTW